MSAIWPSRHGASRWARAQASAAATSQRTHVLVYQDHRNVVAACEVLERVLDCARCRLCGRTARGLRVSASRSRVPRATRGCRGSRAGRRTLVDNQKVALAAEVHVAHARKEEAGNRVLRRRGRAANVMAWPAPARSLRRASSAMMATSDPSAGWRFAPPSAAAICSCYGCRCAVVHSSSSGVGGEACGPRALKT